jgi:hypothetical protein
MKRLLSIFLIVIAAVSCKDLGDDENNPGVSEIIVTGNLSAYSDAASNRSTGTGDPFELKDVMITTDSVKITVSYSGGCKKHKFEIIWNETLSNTTPPQTRFIILHDANGDMCEAYITETLGFPINDLTSAVSFDTLYVDILNGASLADSVSAGGWDPSDTTDHNDDGYKIEFTEGDECVTKVTAMKVICGAGLWDNLWFALDDTISAGIDGFYFHKYLQPVAMDKSIEGFVPIQGKRYVVGGRILKDHIYMSVPVCLAFSGPSVPVKIMCIKELN